jgi:hypothetical protein
VEVDQEEGSTKKRGRKATVGHLEKEKKPKNFVVVLFQPITSTLPIPEAFMPYFGKVPGKITLKTYNGCNWTINTKIVGGRAVLEQGWPSFAIAHDLKVGYMLTFEKVATTEYYVSIFDHTCCDVVTKYPAHADKFASDIKGMEEE